MQKKKKSLTGGDPATVLPVCHAVPDGATAIYVGKFLSIRGYKWIAPMIIISK